MMPGSATAASSSTTTRGVRRMLGERAVEQREHLAVATLRPHGSRVERLEVVGRDRRRPRQQLPLRHAASLRAATRGAG